MARSYPYRITLYMYNGHTETHHIAAANYQDAFSKAHRFANPIAFSGRFGGVQFIDCKKLTKKYCQDRHITLE